MTHFSGPAMNPPSSHTQQGNYLAPNGDFAAPQARPASILPRVAAWLIDWALVVVPAVVTYFVLNYVVFSSTQYFEGVSFFEVLKHGSELVIRYPDEYVMVWIAPLLIGGALGLALCTLGGARGQTPGRKMLGLELVSETTLRPLGGGAALGRALVFYVVPLIALISVVMILADSARRRGLHDTMFKARMIAKTNGAASLRVAHATAPAYGPPAPNYGPPAPSFGPPESSYAPPVSEADTNVMRSPLARNLDAPPAPAAPAAPLPAWLDRTPDPHQEAQQAPQQPPTSAPDTPQTPAQQAPSAPGFQTPSAIVPPTPPPAPEAVPAPADTGLDPEVEMTRLVQPGAARREYRPSSPAPQARIQVSDGQVVDIRGTTLVGRNPAPRPGERAVTLLSVQDPERSVSKTHLALGLDRRGLWAADRTSTNGSVITLADGQQIVCMPEQQVRVSPGAKIQIGAITITVLPV